MSTVAFAETLFDYYDTSKSVKNGDVVCGVIKRDESHPHCFVVLDYSRVLTPEKDPSQKLAKGSVNPRQGLFERVEIRELMVETDASLKTRGDAGASRMVLVKLFWNGKTDVPLANKDVVVGEMVAQEAGLKFNLVQIPSEMGSFGLLYPQRDTARIFGGDSNSDEVKADLQMWIEAVLNSVLPDYFKNSTYAPLKSFRTP